MPQPCELKCGRRADLPLRPMLAELVGLDQVHLRARQVVTLQRQTSQTQVRGAHRAERPPGGCLAGVDRAAKLGFGVAVLPARQVVIAQLRQGGNRRVPIRAA